jgi:hypothetical protein
LVTKTQINPSVHLCCQIKAVCLTIVLIMLGGCAQYDASDKAWLEDIRLANERVKAGDYLAAEDLYLKAKEECQNNFGDNDARTGTCLGYLAELYLGEQEYVKAAVTYRSLIAIERRCAPNSAELERDVKEYEFVQEKLKEYGLQESQKQPGKTEKHEAKAMPTPRKNDAYPRILR